MSVNVRYWRGAWVCDVSTTVAGKRQRSIKAFGAGRTAKIEAEAYAAEARKQLDSGSFRARQTTTFAALWEDFLRFHLASLKPSTAADYKTLGRLYLLPKIGSFMLSDIRVRVLEELKEYWQASSGVKASRGSQKALSDRSVAKLLTLMGTVFRFAQRQELMDSNPAAAIRKPRAAKRTPYMLTVEDIAKLRAALDVPMERLLIELTITTGLRSGEIRGLTWDALDLNGSRLHVEQAVNRKGEAGTTKTERSVRTVPLPAYLIPSFKTWKLACPITDRGLVFPGKGVQPIDADVLLRHVLRRALRKAGLPTELRFHDMRHMAASLMVEAGVSVKRAQEILGHASERTTLAIYTHTLRRQHDDTADKIAALAGLSAPAAELGNNRETIGAADSTEVLVSDCFIGSPGRIRTADQRINSPSLYH
jgi:integrase